MKRHLQIAVFLTASLLAASGSALADKPAWAGGGKPDKHEKRDQNRRDDRLAGVDFRFGDDARRAIYDYYGGKSKQGHCPPGLAKKRNGCLPPGQAKKWQRGYPVPRDVIFHDLPHEILLHLPPPPPRHRYVQVAGDILMIAVGTGMVIDAVEDILR
jgi:Ni/Co efflux regulator RcnB